MIGRRLGVLLTGALSASPASAPNGDGSPFFLCVSHHAPTAVSAPEAGTTATRAAYRQLEGPRQRELREALAESVSRREARLNPLAEDLAEGEPDDRFERLLGAAPEALAVARALATPQYCGSDAFCVRVTTDVCKGDEHLARGSERARARFLAWPYGFATTVRVDAERDLAEAAAALRRRPDVALVLEGPERPSSADELEVLSLLERRARLVRVEEGVAVGEQALVDAPWRGGHRELLVVPTLATVANSLAHPR